MALSIDEAKALARRFGDAELEFLRSVSAPLYWAAKNDGGTISTRGGSAFFLKTSEATFGVTAAHIIEGSRSWREYCRQNGQTPLRLGGRNGTSLALDWDVRALDVSLEMDIVTFAISDREIEGLGRTTYSGYQPSWPPPPPQRDKGVLYCGFPGLETRELSLQAVEFGILTASGIVSSINDTDVSCLIEREYLDAARGRIPPENYNFGGISGGPMLAVIEMKSGIRINSLAGVIYCGPNTSDDPNESIPGFELIRARRAHFIQADGCLDHKLWAATRS